MDKSKEEVFVLRRQTKLPFVWWLLNLRTLAMVGARIMDPEGYFRANALFALCLYSDAAGGDTWLIP
jgi:hypothetical protein